jgi:hypothetical protein
MIHGIKTVVKYFLGTDRAERDFAVYPDDTFVVSYPVPAIPGRGS